MPRPKAACGTPSAYERHIRNREPVDPACRTAQQDRDRKKSTSAPARAQRQAAKVEPPVEPVADAPLTEDGHVSRVEVLKEMLQESRELVKVLRRSDPQRAYLQMREQREILRELAELQGNGQVKGVTLADQLADARARRLAAATAS